MRYNPFDKNVRELTSIDLQKLIDYQVSEGYYIQYESKFPEPKKIAKNIAGFANTYGGWLIVGVTVDKENNVAKEIKGFSLESCCDPIAVVREAVRNFIDPIPTFFAKIVNLESGNVVLVVYIPDDQECPFIHKDGIVYCRVSDSSDPIPGTDRYTLDMLYYNGELVKKKFESLCQKEGFFDTPDEDSLCYPHCAKIFLSPYPTLDVLDMDSKALSVSKAMEKIQKISRDKIKIFLGKDVDEKDILMEGQLTFNAVQNTLESIILHPLENEYKRRDDLLSFELFFNGNAKINIPLRYLKKAEEFRKEIKSPEMIKECEITPHLFSGFTFFKFSELCLAIGVLISYYQSCLGDIKSILGIKTAIKINNVVHAVVPFIDSDKWLFHVQKFSIPFIGKGSIDIPPDLGYPLFIGISEGRINWKEIISYIGLALGLPMDVQDELINYRNAEIFINEKGEVNIVQKG